VEEQMAKRRSETKIIRTGAEDTLILEYGKLNALEERMKALESRIQILEKAAKPSSGTTGRRPPAGKGKATRRTEPARKSKSAASRLR
jgi:tetrahydromethanopterin S-methyltransferase subunit B